MNKKILVIPIFLAMFAFMITPAMGYYLKGNVSQYECEGTQLVGTGYTVNALNADGTVNATNVTESDGEYYISLANGTYTLQTYRTTDSLTEVTESVTVAGDTIEDAQVRAGYCSAEAYDSDDAQDGIISGLGGYAIGIAGVAILLGLFWGIGKVRTSFKM